MQLSLSCATRPEMTKELNAKAVLMALGLMRLAVMGLYILSVQAREIEKVNFADNLDVAGQKLVLNGVALRTRHKFGMDFRVYVAGLYLAKKNSNSPEILAGGDKKLLRLVFLRSVDKDTLREAWEESYLKNCKSECAGTKALLVSFNDLMADVKDGSELKIEFSKDSVTTDMKGKQNKTGKIEGAAFARTLLAVFIGDEPPSPEFKNGLLGK
jgi:hypothetical protein